MEYSDESCRITMEDRIDTYFDGVDDPSPQDLENCFDEAFEDDDCVCDALVGDLELLRDLRNSIPCVSVAGRYVKSVNDINHLDAKHIKAIANAAILYINDIEEKAARIMGD